MSVLGNSDYREIKKRIHGDPAARAEFKTWALSKATWMTVFQTMEDWFINGVTVQPPRSLQAELELVVPGSPSVAQVKQVARAWVAWRLGKVL